MNPFVDARNLEIGGYSDKGARERNEDTYLIDRELGLVVLSDGVGGHQCGEVLFMYHLLVQVRIASAKWNCTDCF